MRTIILPILILISFSYLHAQKDEHEALGRVHVAPVDTIKKYTGVEVYVKNGQDFFTTQYNDKTTVLMETEKNNGIIEESEKKSG